MVNEATKQEILKHFRASVLRYPMTEQADAVKFVFQALLGVGHLLSSREAVERYLVSELRELSPDPNEPLFEPLGPVWGRLNLRRALAEAIPPSAIAEQMFASKPSEYTRRDVYAFCRELSASGEPLFADAAALERILDEDRLPSHSESYRERYHPAYRVLAADRVRIIYPSAGSEPQSHKRSILIKDTTREERMEIVRRSLWGACGSECEFCSGCDNLGGGRADDLYQPYIDGEREIAEINAAYRAPFVR